MFVELNFGESRNLTYLKFRITTKTLSNDGILFIIVY